MAALLERCVISRRLARLLGRAALSGPDISSLCALAALHDMGKISQGFQRGPFPGGPAPRGHIRPLLSLMLNERSETAATRQREKLNEAGGLERWLDLLGEHDDWQALKAMLAHHGSLPSTEAVETALWHATPRHDPVAACRALTDAIATWFPEAEGGVIEDWTPEFGHAFAGLLMLADWLGSDETVFPITGERGAPDGVARYDWSRREAKTLLSRRFIAPDEARAACRALRWEIEPLTGFSAASAAQAAMLALPPAAKIGRTCLIEDETGSGKTEAALIHFLRLFDQGAVDGLYFALPTRAAAVQIHGRIDRALPRLLGASAPPVILAVPGYDDPAAATLPPEGALWAEHPEDALWASARPKRYLAACVAVGTVDQALLGGLKVRHAQLRSSAMLRLLLVVDEIHATDVYMTKILRNLLGQHHRAGGHALLMSATLGSDTRRWLLGGAPVGLTEAIATPYPAAWTDADGLLADAAPPLAHPQKRVRIVLDPGWADSGHAAALAIEAARRGARVLVIRNTVAAVVATQMALEAVAPALSLMVGDVPAPHHARYAPEDRRLLDAALEAVLRAGAGYRGGSVTVASQTAEQSLDIDADLLVTDLCPADVLLQRIGRLHRKRGRTPVPGFEEACAVVLAPTQAELAASISATGEVRGKVPLALGRVYPDLLGVVATRRAFEERDTIAIPADNRRLVEQATHEEALDALAKTLGGRWSAHRHGREGTLAAHEGEAAHACLRWTGEITPLPDLGEKIRTRLGVDDRLVELPAGTIGPFGHAITRLTMPGWWLKGAAMVAEPTFSRDEHGALVIGLDGAVFAYDRLGLRSVGARAI